MNKALLHNFPQKLTPYKIDIADDPDTMVDGRKTIDCILVDMYLPPSGPVVAELRSDGDITQSCGRSKIEGVSYRCNLS